MRTLLLLIFLILLYLQQNIEGTSSNLKASSNTSMKVLNNDIKSSKKKWAKELFDTAQRRFRRMLRSGWISVHTLFCWKFIKNKSLVQFKVKETFKLQENPEGDTSKHVKTLGNPEDMSILPIQKWNSK